MRTSDFFYSLPPELIAQAPLAERHTSRLLHLSRATHHCVHRQFTDLPQLLQPGDLLVVNDSQVIPARLFGQKKTGGQVELLIERVLNNQKALAHIRASKSPKPGTALIIADHEVTVVERHHERLFLLKLEDDKAWLSLLEQAGHMPLPPYIKRDDTPSDRECYQTIFAAHKGSVAAPTAGLHFTSTLLEQLNAHRIHIASLTLHVGAGTFLPVQTDDIQKHHMHQERIDVSSELCNKIIETKKQGGRVIAVGTTVVRALETAALSGHLHPFCGETDIFITPGFRFKVVDALVTNFHLPESTLLMLVSAFASRQQILSAYQEAIAKRYRFFSYGDAMFIE